MLGIITSEQDPVGKNVRAYFENHFSLKEQGSFEESAVYVLPNKALLIHTQKDLLYANHLDSFFPEVHSWIFASRHKSQSEKPTLTAHSTGNWSQEALHGGNPEELSFASPELIQLGLIALNNYSKDLKTHFDVSLEVTHHGPTSLKKPLIFIEIGSSEKQWHIEGAIETLANSLIDVTSKKAQCKKAIAFGGGHYPDKFSRIVLDGEYSIGHILPKYHSETVTSKMICQAVEKNGGVDLAIIDWKGLKGPIRSNIIDSLKTKGIEVVKSRNL